MPTQKTLVKISTQNCKEAKDAKSKKRESDKYVKNGFSRVINGFKYKYQSLHLLLLLHLCDEIFRNI